MQNVIQIETSIDIQAPVELVFDLVRDVRVHMQTTDWTRERVVHCTADTMLKKGDIVTFEARHFGITQRLTSKVIECDPPSKLVDKMVRGAFRSLVHEHLFVTCSGHTRMTDRITLQAPIFVLGWIVERAILAQYMRTFLDRRNHKLKEIAESMVESRRLG